MSELGNKTGNIRSRTCGVKSIRICDAAASRTADEESENIRLKNVMAERDCVDISTSGTCTRSLPNDFVASTRTCGMYVKMS